RGEVTGGIWEAKSNPQTADLIIEGDLETFWQPNPDDALDQWSVQIDLGRPVLARQIRLVFPDSEGVRPLRQFSVFVASGARIQALNDVFKFEAVYRTSKPNTATELVIPLEYLRTDSTYVLDEGLKLDLEREKRFQVIQYIIIEIDEHSPGVGLAEVEVLAVGDNVSLGTAGRGGSFLEGGRTTGAALMFDGDMDSFALLTSAEGGWVEAGVWWRVDLGAVFFLDELFIYFSQLGEGLRSQVQGGNPSAAGGLFLVSDGRPAAGSGLPVPERVDYEVLVEDRCRPQCLGRLFHQRYLFAPRKVRYLLWHEIDGTPQGFGWGLEAMLFSSGHPAEVNLRSDFIDLASQAGNGRPQVIERITWEADLPPQTKIQLRSRSGNALRELYTFFDRKGDIVTEEKWNSLPKVLKGSIDTTLVVGEDWDAWSNVYQSSGESFQSASPRRFVQLEMILATDDPQVAPAVNALAIEFTDALVQEARGQIWPREARLNEDTRFTYTLWPSTDGQDSGFDRLRFHIPGVATGNVALRIGGEAVAPDSVKLHGDSLLVLLPHIVVADSVEVDFTARLWDNAALFALDLGMGERPGIWQSVVPSERRANIVLLPDLPVQAALVGDVEIAPVAFTPNGDEVNDAVEISFIVFKAKGIQPQVRIFDVAGRLVAQPTGSEVAGRWHFRWSGRTAGDELALPGMYFCLIDPGAASSGEAVLRPLAVAY
ncbi:MAG: gliding motility-associated C-terminal domain-containing protein, partial [Gemmatimonadetes bacterium]|nr:gliding motility-associated C-terminal domain-containing protein [Gemmatimonadota bacterium]